MIEPTAMRVKNSAIAIAALVVLVIAVPCVVTGNPLAHRDPRVVDADAHAIEREIAADRGHVVVVNFWATWCAPCVAEFPALVKLHNTYAKRGVIVIAVSADTGRKYIRRVPQFIKAQKARFPNYVLTTDKQEAAIDLFDSSWDGDLPRTFIYDKQGHLAKVLAEGQTYASFVSAIKPLL